MEQRLKDFYDKAYKFSLENYNDEIKWISNLKESDITDQRFFSEYVWVVLCSGFSVKYARVISDKFHENFDFNIIKHPLKRKAIELGSKKFKEWFKKINSIKKDEEKLEFLETLPHIGVITKYHLAKNIGLNVAKPDVHLTRIAQKFGFSDVQLFCDTIAKDVGHRKNLVDQVIWRYCEQHPDYLEELK